MGTDKEKFRCDVCGGGEFEVIYKYSVPTSTSFQDCIKSITGQLEHVVCKNCGYITVFPKPSEKEISSYYATAATPSPQAFLAKKPIYDEAEAFARKHVSSARCIVEVGSSYGHFLQRFVDYTDELIGIEPSGKCCDYAASNYSIRLYALFSKNLTYRK